MGLCYVLRSNVILCCFLLLLRETVALDYEDLSAGGGGRRTMECSLKLYYVASFSFYLSILFQDNSCTERGDEK